MDAFLNASPTYRQAIRTQTRPMSLAAFEVAELPRSERWPPLGTAVFMFAAGLVGWWLIFLAVGFVAQLKGY